MHRSIDSLDLWIHRAHRPRYPVENVFIHSLTTSVLFLAKSKGGNGWGSALCPTLALSISSRRDLILYLTLGYSSSPWSDPSIRKALRYGILECENVLNGDVFDAWWTLKVWLSVGLLILGELLLVSVDWELDPWGVSKVNLEWSTLKATLRKLDATFSYPHFTLLYLAYSMQASVYSTVDDTSEMWTSKESPWLSG